MKEIKIGEFFTLENGRIGKIMAVSENWAMFKFKGCVPFCIMIKEIPVRFGVKLARA